MHPDTQLGRFNKMCCHESNFTEIKTKSRFCKKKCDISCCVYIDQNKHIA